MLKRITKAIEDPGLLQTWLLTKLNPAGYRNKIIHRCKSAGFKTPRFVLSFDCDLDSDSTVVTKIHSQLRSGGIFPVYAVPGEVLIAAAGIYQDLAKDTSIFINHGFKRHALAQSKDGAHSRVATYFYETLSEAEWKKDITLGHSAVADIIGKPPNTFRTPHFAGFESPTNLGNLWKFLASHSYLYSSSTRPLFGVRYGPVFYRNGIMEFPLSGCLSQPEQILDSWGLIGQTADGQGRLKAELQTYLSLMESGEPILLNVYMDPGDIVDSPDIIDMLCRFSPFSAKSFGEAAEANFIRHA